MNSVCLLALGKVVYMGEVNKLDDYLQFIENPRESDKNLADHIITVTANNNFGSETFNVSNRIRISNLEIHPANEFRTLPGPFPEKIQKSIRNVIWITFLIFPDGLSFGWD